jgi:hypothetical protein
MQVRSGFAALVAKRKSYDWTRQHSAAVRAAQKAYDAGRSRKDGRSANV